MQKFLFFKRSCCKTVSTFRLFLLLQLSSVFFTLSSVCHAIIVAVTEGPVREEQLLHDMCLLGAVTVEITQILTRAAQIIFKRISEPLLR